MWSVVRLRSPRTPARRLTATLLHDEGLRGIDDALAQARAYLSEAWRNAAAAAQRDAARRVREELAVFVAHGACLDGALVALAEAAVEVGGSLKRLNTLQHVIEYRWAEGHNKRGGRAQPNCHRSGVRWRHSCVTIVLGSH
jgi:hypothetical protein